MSSTATTMAAPLAPAKPIVTPKEKAIAALTNERIMAALKTVATKHLTAERVVRLMIGEFSRNPKLTECDPKSLVLAALAFSQLGLEPGSHLGLAYAIPRQNKHTGRLEANFQLGYRGKIALNYRTGMYEFIHAACVYRDDQFTYEYGTSAFLRHVPNHDSARRNDDDIVSVYAMAHLKGSTHPLFRVLSRKEIDRLRLCSQTPNKGPWVDFFPAMCCKSAIHALEHYMPMSTEVVAAHAIEERSESGELSFADFADVEIMQDDEPTSASGTDGLKKKLNIADPSPASAGGAE